MSSQNYSVNIHTVLHCITHRFDNTVWCTCVGGLSPQHIHQLPWQQLTNRPCRACLIRVASYVTCLNLSKLGLQVILFSLASVPAATHKPRSSNLSKPLVHTAALQYMLYSIYIIYNVPCSIYSHYIYMQLMCNVMVLLISRSRVRVSRCTRCVSEFLRGRALS